MNMRWLAAVFAVLLAACAHQPGLLERPDRVWAAPRGLDATAACVIRVLDERGSRLMPPVTHGKRVTERGEAYEIRPARRKAVTAETYHVRLEKAGDRITRMSLFAESPWRKDMIEALSPCGRRG
jgi:hypothetical protein